MLHLTVRAIKARRIRLARPFFSLICTYVLWTSLWRPLKAWQSYDCFNTHGEKSLQNPPIDVSFATIIKGDEWSIYRKERILSNTLYALLSVTAASKIFIFADKDCDKFPTHFKEVNCLPTWNCHDYNYDAPTVSCILGTFIHAATTENVVFLNSDIVIFRSFMASLATSMQLENYVMVGQRSRARRDILKYEILATLECEARELKLEGGFALDYFAFKRSNPALRQLPNFIVGNWRWDNVLLTLLYKSGSNIIDATRTAPVWHQNPYKTWFKHDQRRAASFNDDLAHKIMGEDFLYGNVNNAAFYTTFDRGKIELSEVPNVSLATCVLQEGNLMKILRSQDMEPDRLGLFLRDLPRLDTVRPSRIRNCTLQLEKVLQNYKSL